MIEFNCTHIPDKFVVFTVSIQFYGQSDLAICVNTGKIRNTFFPYRSL